MAMSGEILRSAQNDKKRNFVALSTPMELIWNDNIWRSYNLLLLGVESRHHRKIALFSVGFPFSEGVILITR